MLFLGTIECLMTSNCSLRLHTLHTAGALQPSCAFNPGPPAALSSGGVRRSSLSGVPSLVCFSVAEGAVVGPLMADMAERRAEWLRMCPRDLVPRWCGRWYQPRFSVPPVASMAKQTRPSERSRLPMKASGHCPGAFWSPEQSVRAQSRRLDDTSV